MRAGLWCLLLYVWLGGCASHSVRCDGPLQPINAPAVQGAAQHAQQHPQVAQ